MIPLISLTFRDIIGIIGGDRSPSKGGTDDAREASKKVHAEIQVSMMLEVLRGRKVLGQIARAYMVSILLRV
ncbi:MAG: hypothetical protein IBX60_08020 [Candidatus Aminicenantes bacterium]|nr:hypothetical protein [Candidatus Aminicenantes bacterium]